MDITKAPWRVSDDGECIVATDAHGEILVIAKAMHGNESDMKLLAAAPDLRAVLDELEDAFDREIEPEQRREDYDAPDDREYSVTITAKQWRAFGRALNRAENG